MILAWVGSAWACGPDFPMRLLHDRGRALAELPEGTFVREVGALVPPEPFPYVVDEGTDPGWREVADLPPAQASVVRAMRAERDPARALALGASLPPDLRLYTAGAVAWHVDQPALALDWWGQVLALPEAPLRGVAAAYMLAPTAGGGSSYAEVRRRAREGGADPWGLAVASFGEEARGAAWAGDPVQAVHLYATQAAHGSASGASSLLFVARWLFADRRRLEGAIADPVVQALATTYAWTRGAELAAPLVTDGLPVAIDAEPARVSDLLAMLERFPTVSGADRAAATAYRAGRYDEAGRWASRSSEPLAAWVRSKLALRAGDPAAAARELAAAEPAARGAGAGATRCRWWGETGALAVARGAYDEALDAWVEAARAGYGGNWFGDGWEDAAYVAERVMSTDELLAWLDARPPADDPIGLRLRALAARRLMRDGRTAEALARFDDPALRARAAAYADAMARATAADPVTGAEALLEAAAVAREGLELFGTELEPDFAVYEGEYARWLDPPEPHPWFGSDEQARVRRSAPRPDTRFHYRARAADLAVAAADRLPHTSLAYVTALCRAAAYVRWTDADRFHALWRRYVATGPLVREGMEFGARCPAPDWPAARADWIRTRRSGAWAVAAGLAVALVAILAWLGGSRWIGSRS